MERRLAAILSADVVGYSRLMAEDEAGTLRALTNLRKTSIEPLIAQHRGRLVKLMGDGFLVEFPSVVDAVTCAIAWQSGPGASGADRPFGFRIGINLGDIIIEESDIYGDGVNVAARLQEIAEPGGIMLSATVLEHIRGRIEVAVEDRGESRLKNIDRPLRLYAVKTGQPIVRAKAAPSPADEAAPRTDRPSIAVLPFDNMSGDAEQQYFSDGMTEDIITELSRYRALSITARHSSFRFRGNSVDIADVRRALGVRYVVEGSVRKIGNRIRVTAQLIDASTLEHLWAERYDRGVEEIFALQDEVTRSIASMVAGRVAATGVEDSRKKPTTEWAAYDYLLQGRDLVHRYRNDGEAVRLLTRAIELDPNFGQAYAWRALALCNQSLLDSNQEMLDAALASAQRALALDGNDASACHAMGVVAMYRDQLDLAGQHLDRAARLNPNDVYIASDRANWLCYVGRYGEALEAFDLIQQRDPYPPAWLYETIGQTLFCLKRFEEAISAYLAPSENQVWTSGLVASAQAHLGRLDEAQRLVRIFQQEGPAKTITELKKRLHVPDGMRDLLLDGLRMAGMPE